MLSKINKSAVRAALLAQEHAEHAAAEAAFRAYFDEAVRPDDTVLDPEHAAATVRDRPAQELAEARAHAHAGHLAALAGMAFTASTVVEVGAVVQIGARVVVVAVPTQPFDVDGIRMIGIAPDAPLAAAMMGLAAGDTFELGERELTITAVA
ncbi:MAG: hypothetical protein R3B06_27010 [Kofleriaceae bacterium]